MSVTVVIGGQYGSEGKGKVAHSLAREQNAAAMVRVGGPNSGHTSFAGDGSRQVLRQLPMTALDGGLCLLGPGSYIDPAVLLEEVSRLGLGPDRVCVDYRAMTIAPRDAEVEGRRGLGERIGSTCSGTGAAVQRRIERRSQDDLVIAAADLRPFLGDSVARMREVLGEGRRVIVEGTQGFGLSLLQSPHFPYVTTRDTSAAGAISEAGLSPLDVDEVVMVLRAFPIRVAGRSGPFDSEEIDWETVAREAGLEDPPEELTSVTRRVRRVARFEPTIVAKAIAANRPTRVVMNHLDHVDARCRDGLLTSAVHEFLARAAAGIGREIDYIGIGPGPEDLLPLNPSFFEKDRQPKAAWSRR
jgi:adenylosuccinate synthase